MKNIIRKQDFFRSLGLKGYITTQKRSMLIATNVNMLTVTFSVVAKGANLQNIKGHFQYYNKKI